jgi:hypothetical protein
LLSPPMGLAMCAYMTVSEYGLCARADAMADDVGERTVKSGCRWDRRFLTWAAASPGISGRSLTVRAAIADHVDDQGRPIQA